MRRSRVADRFRCPRCKSRQTRIVDEVLDANEVSPTFGYPVRQIWECDALRLPTSLSPIGVEVLDAGLDPDAVRCGARFYVEYEAGQPVRTHYPAAIGQGERGAAGGG